MGVTPKNVLRRSSGSRDSIKKQVKRKSCSGDWSVASVGAVPKKQEGSPVKNSRKSGDHISKKVKLEPEEPQNVNEFETQESEKVIFSDKKDVADESNSEEESNSEDESSGGKESSGEEESNSKKVANSKKAANSKKVASGDSNIKADECLWNGGDLLELVGRIEDMFPHYLSMNTSKAVEKIDWNKVSFKDFSAENCKKTWTLLEEKSRSTRELVDESRKFLLDRLPKSRLEKLSELGNATYKDCVELKLILDNVDKHEDKCTEISKNDEENNEEEETEDDDDEEVEDEDEGEKEEEEEEDDDEEEEEEEEEEENDSDMEEG